jgi:hypothetical protein
MYTKKAYLWFSSQDLQKNEWCCFVKQFGILDFAEVAAFVGTILEGTKGNMFPLHIGYFFLSSKHRQYSA